MELCRKVTINLFISSQCLFLCYVYFWNTSLCHFKWLLKKTFSNEIFDKNAIYIIIKNFILLYIYIL